ncbi:xanthine dehydrogenase small subunit [Nocardioides euryhalodurans]|uniref:2Fe-2S iron-sulfur cluster binding domain-containing protein n=1 Tax=Nocardioides euryhalodurans TaxID=2518370 RepID=A0A4P7GKD2_9ACTN|nr:FAD binding domain-containing protein [Nocardioides euryhalodurans]QBR92131.1 2Fe-2S iron-sulfur cluster binding domain-containing protein [Nocardioides euryhalodurans]
MEGQGSVTVNGTPRALAGTRVHTSLLDFLRDQGLTGAKEGCAEGECGACSVMVARPDGSQSQWTALNACLVPATAYDGQEVVTAEGLGSPDRLHPVQRELADRGGSQCGYCTPGFVCSMAAEFYRRDRAPGEPDHEHGPNGFDLHALSGNLCRCTGYRPIRDAAWALEQPEGADPLAARLADPAPAPVPSRVSASDAGFVRPADLDEALAVLAEHPDAVVVAGSTDWGVEVNLRGRRAPHVVMVDRLPELRGVEVAEHAVTLGAALTLTELEHQLAGRVPLLDEVWPQFASRLIRNGATLGGNLGTGSPIGDTPPALLALEASLLLVSERGEREVALADYFTGYRASVRRPDELIRAVRVPLPLSPVVGFHKVAKRRFDDISGVAIGFALDVADGVVRKARIGLGGVAATPVRALATEAALEGRPWTSETVAGAAEVMRGEGTPIDDMRASAAYRSAMLANALPRLFAEVGDR